MTEAITLTSYLEVSLYVMWASTIAGAGFGLGWRIVGMMWGERGE